MPFRHSGPATAAGASEGGGRRLSCPITAEPDTTSDAREERLARNEVIFRTVNEAIEQKALELGGPGGYQFICECSAADCFDRITLSLPEYEHVRAQGTRFLVRPGHENVALELVVEERPGYVIVEKDGMAGIVASDHDPRDGDPEPG